MSGCEEVREILVAVARGEVVSAPGQAFLREHVEGCPQCRRRLANERMLTSGLGALASASASTAAGLPPPAVRTALMAEFRRHKTVVPIRRPVVKWSLVAAIAAALLVALLLANGHRAGLAVDRSANVPLALAPPPVPAPVIPAVRAEVRQPVLKAKARTIRRQHVAAPPVAIAEAAKTSPATEIATDFFEIPYAEPLRPDERGDVFRIQMPRANMAIFGLPVTGGRLDSRVTADVLMGEDGVARAIRFIR